VERSKNFLGAEGSCFARGALLLGWEWQGHALSTATGVSGLPAMLSSLVAAVKNSKSNNLSSHVKKYQGFLSVLRLSLAGCASVVITFGAVILCAFFSRNGNGHFGRPVLLPSMVTSSGSVVAGKSGLFSSNTRKKIKRMLV